MERNLNVHVLADLLWVISEGRGLDAAQSLYNLLRLSYQARQMDWHAQCLDLAWQRYSSWEQSGPDAITYLEPANSSKIDRSRVKPAYPIRLERRGKWEWEFAWPGEMLKLMPSFNEGCACLASDPARARRVFHMIINKCPYFIQAHNQLALLEMNMGNRVRAKTGFQRSLEIGSSVVPDDFKGRLTWTWPENRPFLRSIYGLSLVLLQEGNYREAKKLLEQLLKHDPDDILEAKPLLNDIKKVL